MSSKSKQGLKSILHPFLFVLKEGRGIKNDYLDYSLMMLHINSSETIRSPEEQGKFLSMLVPEMDIVTATIPAFLGRGDR